MPGALKPQAWVREKDDHQDQRHEHLQRGLPGGIGFGRVPESAQRSRHEVRPRCPAEHHPDAPSSTTCSGCAAESLSVRDAVHGCDLRRPATCIGINAPTARQTESVPCAGRWNSAQMDCARDDRHCYAERGRAWYRPAATSSRIRAPPRRAPLAHAARFSGSRRDSRRLGRAAAARCSGVMASSASRACGRYWPNTRSA
jgi:hypothetical protein